MYIIIFITGAEKKNIPWFPEPRDWSIEDCFVINAETISDVIWMLEEAPEKKLVFMLLPALARSSTKLLPKVRVDRFAPSESKETGEQL